MQKDDICRLQSDVQALATSAPPTQQACTVESTKYLPTRHRLRSCARMSRSWRKLRARWTRASDHTQPVSTAPSRLAAAAVLPALFIAVRDARQCPATVLPQWTPVVWHTYSNCSPHCQCHWPGHPVHLEWRPYSDCSLHVEPVDPVCSPLIHCAGLC